MDSKEVKALLLNRYCPPQYATFFEVGSSTGGASTYADAVSFNLYRSSGHEVSGFEVKVGRGDWLNELKQPGKAEPVMRYCDRWWIVAPKGVVQTEEVPKAWGFYEVVNGKFFARKRAPELKPDPLDPKFIAATARTEAEDRIKAAESKYENVLKEIEAWEQQTGLKVFSPYTKGNDLGAAVRFILNGGARRLLSYDLDSLVTQADKVLRTAKELKEMRNQLPEVPADVPHRNW
jgi:hypothetical protein